MKLFNHTFIKLCCLYTHNVTNSGCRPCILECLHQLHKWPRTDNYRRPDTCRWNSLSVYTIVYAIIFVARCGVGPRFVGHYRTSGVMLSEMRMWRRVFKQRRLLLLSTVSSFTAVNVKPETYVKLFNSSSYSFVWQFVTSR